MSAVSASAAVPSAPRAYSITAAIGAADLAAMKTEMAMEQALRDSIFPKANEAKTEGVHAVHAFQCGDMAEARRLLDACRQGVEAVLDEVAAGPRPWYVRGAPSVGSLLEHYACAFILGHFFESGVLPPRSALPRLEDSEYLLGCMAFCQELSRYAIGRATEGDVGSVLACKELVNSCFQKLAEFDFRNGPLRRKFDGVKYVVRKCEDLLYELSLSGKYVPPPADSAAPPAKKAKAGAADGGSAPPSDDAEFPRITAARFDEMRVKIEAYDAQREELIKRTRDVQKLSKQSIYSMHRGDFAKAEAQLLEATTKAQAHIWIPPAVCGFLK